MMSEIVLRSSEPNVLASHMALIGLTSIAEEAFGPGAVRAHWSAGMAPRPVVSVDGHDPAEVAEAVRTHAERANAWLGQTFPDAKGTPRGLMSPRRSLPVDRAGWSQLMDRRRAAIDDLASGDRYVDLRMIGGMGEPSHWHRGRNGDLQADRGASRFDMQARNQGSELVTNKLLKLATVVSRRSAKGILEGLSGVTVIDDLGGGSASLTATGLAPPAPYDSVLAWCAHWGMSGLPVAPRVRESSRTTGTIGRGQNELFALPVVATPVLAARLRSLCADERTSQYLRPRDLVSKRAAADWLASRGVRAIATFEVAEVGTASSPRRSAQLGQLLPVAARTWPA